MPNENFLVGFRCPKCGQTEEFRIEISAVAQVTDDCVEITGDTEWNNNSYCSCPKCDHDGIVEDFMEAEQETSGGS